MEGESSTCSLPLGDTYESVDHSWLNAYVPEPIETYHIRDKGQFYFDLDFQYPF